MSGHDEPLKLISITFLVVFVKPWKIIDSKVLIATAIIIVFKPKPSKMIRAQEAALFITDPKTLRDSLVRNGYYVPSAKCNLLSFEFMDGVSSSFFADS